MELKIQPGECKNVKKTRICCCNTDFCNRPELASIESGTSVKPEANTSATTRSIEASVVTSSSIKISTVISEKIIHKRK